MRLAVDMGGTLTDLVLENERGDLELYKSPTTPERPIDGLLGVIDVAAQARDESVRNLLAAADELIHGTTHGLNAVITRRVARTALLCTQGHPDILVFREGGRPSAFDMDVHYPAPYVPRSLTFEVEERIGSRGELVVSLDEAGARAAIETALERGAEAVGVCFLWSVVNPVHEERVGELMDEIAPGVPFTLSSRLNPILREYRRASSTVIDASLKPLMSGYFSELERALRDRGFAGRLLIVTSTGGVMDAADVAAAPIHTLRSGPSTAPVAGRLFARRDADAQTAVVTDTGGTTFDVSVVRSGALPHSRETWIGPRHLGHMTGFPAVDVRSIGAGGGSVARVDGGGMLRVGPESAGADPGPACFGRGGTEPTVTDAALVTGLLDPGRFLDGRMPLVPECAEAAIARQIAEPLGVSVVEAAQAVLEVSAEEMARAIEEIALDHGVDHREAVLVAGGGAAGLGAVAIARRLGCRRIIVPRLGAALSAVGALASDLSRELAAAVLTTTAGFDRDAVNRALASLRKSAERFLDEAGAAGAERSIECVAEARYARQVWEVEVPLEKPSLDDDADLERFSAAMHRVHRELYAVEDPNSQIEIVGLRVRARKRRGRLELEGPPPPGVTPARERTVAFVGERPCQARVVEMAELRRGELLHGPAVVEARSTTIALDPGAVARLGTSGLVIDVARGSCDEAPAGLEGSVRGVG